MQNYRNNEHQLEVGRPRRTMDPVRVARASVPETQSRVNLNLIFPR
jgi:hypothetical protein